MTSRAKDIISTFHKFSLLQTKILEKIMNLDEKEIESILSNNVDFRIQLEPKTYKELESKTHKELEPVPEKKLTPSNRIKNSQQDLTQEKLEEISNTLNLISDKTEGDKYLQEVCLDRKSLKILAEYLDADRRENSVIKLRQAIVEATIGIRLRSSAIQGKKIEIPKPKESEKEVKIAPIKEDLSSENLEEETLKKTSESQVEKMLEEAPESKESEKEGKIDLINEDSISEKLEEERLRKKPESQVEKMLEEVAEGNDDQSTLNTNS